SSGGQSRSRLLATAPGLGVRPLALEHELRRAAQVHIALAVPLDCQRSARLLDLDATSHSALQPRGDHRGAAAAAAGQRLAYAALPDPQGHSLRCSDLGDAEVHALAESRV